MMTLISLLMIMLIISFLLMFINFTISKKKMMNREKSTPFECGFDPMSNSRLPFSMQFYLISIIFLIFDIEIIIFLPFIPSLIYSSFYYITMTILIFIFILIIGLYFEWKGGALNWLK